MPPSVLCTGLPQQTVLAWQLAGEAPSSLVIGVGITQLADQALHHVPPRPSELEHAIDLVEEALTGLPQPWPAGALLQPAGLFDLVLPHLGDPGRSAVEDLFQRLASWSLGHPSAAQGLPQDCMFIAAALLLRELTHHLSFETLAPNAG
jgi:hypothetical protein